MPGQLRGLEAGVVALFREARVTPQPIEQLAVGRLLGEPCWLEVPQAGERGVVEGKSPLGIEHGDGVGDKIEDRLLRRLLAADPGRGAFDLGDVLGPNATPARPERLGPEAQSSTFAAYTHPAQDGPDLAGASRFAGDAVGLTIQGQAACARFGERRGSDGGKP